MTGGRRKYPAILYCDRRRREIHYYLTVLYRKKLASLTVTGGRRKYAAILHCVTCGRKKFPVLLYRKYLAILHCDRRSQQISSLTLLWPVAVAEISNLWLDQMRITEIIFAHKGNKKNKIPFSTSSTLVILVSFVNSSSCDFKKTFSCNQQKNTILQTDQRHSS